MQYEIWKQQNVLLDKNLTKFVTPYNGKDESQQMHQTETSNKEINLASTN